MNPLFQDPRVAQLLAAQQQNQHPIQNQIQGITGQPEQQSVQAIPTSQQPMFQQVPQQAPQQVNQQQAPQPMPIDPNAAWKYNQQAQYAQHDQNMQITDALHTAVQSPEGLAFQKGMPDTDWSKIHNTIDQHQQDMANSNPALDYIGNHGVMSATTTAAQGGSNMDVAASMLGKSAGQDHKTLSQFFEKAGFGNVDPRSTPWCAAFANSVLQAGGLQGSGSLAAKSLLKIGQPLDKSDVTKGDIVVFNDLTGNNNPNKGHVGFVDHFSPDGKMVYTLGGNQGGTVAIKAYPTDSVAGFRRPNASSIKDGLQTPQQQRDPQNPNSNVNMAIQQSRRTYSDNPVMADVAASQAILESRLNGTPSNLALHHNNYFGIKGEGTNGSASMATTEGSNTRTKANFAAYNNPEESFQAHKDLMSKDRYNSVMNAPDFDTAAKNLQKAGYATDPNYARQLIKIHNEYFRSGAGSIPNAPMPTTNDTSNVTPSTVSPEKYNSSVQSLDKGLSYE